MLTPAKGFTRIKGSLSANHIREPLASILADIQCHPGETSAKLSPHACHPLPHTPAIDPRQGHGSHGSELCLGSKRKDIQRRKGVGCVEEPAGLPGQPEAHTVKGVGTGTAQLRLQWF